MIGPDDRTIQHGLADDSRDTLDCMWVFASGVLVGIFLATVTVFAAMYLASFHPELQRLN